MKTVHEILKLIKKSPKRNALLKKLKQELARQTIGVCVPCMSNLMDSASSVIAKHFK